MRRALLIAVLCSAVLPSAMSQDQFDAIRATIQSKMLERHVPSMAVAVAKGDKILWEQGFGWADREKRIPADANTMYSLASISKSLTATALMTLVNAGKIDLDKPINDYLGDAKLHARVGDINEATVRRVANHSAGLPEYYQFFYENEALRRPSDDETIRRFGNLVTAPGERYQYSNLGYGVLDSVISRVSGKSYADYMRKEVFLKLGMTRSAVGTETPLKQFEAVRYDGEDLSPIAPYVTDHPGASEIYSSAHDLALFGMFSLKAHLESQTAILPDSAIDAMQEPTIASGPGVGYGIGWEKDTTGGATIVSHSGGMPGVATWLRLVPAEKYVIVVLCNEDDHLAHEIADDITTQLVPAWKPAAPAPPRAAFVPSSDLVGRWRGSVQTYKSTTPFELDIDQSGEVRVQLGKQPATLLDHPWFGDGYLHGAFSGDMDIPEAARRPYVISVSLKLRDGKVLNGAVTARTDGVGTMPAAELPSSAGASMGTLKVEKSAFVLAQWGELTKQ